MQNREGASICQSCDFILDDSFLAGDGEDGADARAEGEDTGVKRAPTAEDDTQAGPPPVPSRARPAAPARPPRHGSRFIAGKQGETDDFVADEPQAQPEEGGDPNDDWRAELRRERESRAAEEQRQAAEAPPQPKLSEEQRIVGDLKAVFSKGKGAYKGLERPDQLCLLGAGGMFLMCFFPWVSIEHQGARIGLEVGGWVLILLAGCIGGAVFLRKSPHWQTRQKPLALGQVGAVALAILFCLSKLLTLNSIKVMVPEADLDVPAQAQVQFGVFLALLSAGVAALGTWPTLRSQVLKR